MGTRDLFVGKVKDLPLRKIPLHGKASLGSRWRVTVTALSFRKGHREPRCWPSYLVVEKVTRLTIPCVVLRLPRPRPAFLHDLLLSLVSLFPTVHGFFLEEPRIEYI